jgi:hypothetical protein
VCGARRAIRGPLRRAVRADSGRLRLRIEGQRDKVTAVRERQALRGWCHATEDLHERLQGIQGFWDRALADLHEVSGGLEAIIKTPGENDLVAIAKHYSRDPKVFAIGMFDAVIMLKALTTVLEMTEPMLKKILPLTAEERLEAQDEVLHRLLDHVEAQGSA